MAALLVPVVSQRQVRVLGAARRPQPQAVELVGLEATLSRAMAQVVAATPPCSGPAPISSRQAAALEEAGEVHRAMTGPMEALVLTWVKAVRPEHLEIREAPAGLLGLPIRVGTVEAPTKIAQLGPAVVEAEVSMEGAGVVIHPQTRWAPLEEAAALGSSLARARRLLPRQVRPRPIPAILIMPTVPDREALPELTASPDVSS